MTGLSLVMKTQAVDDKTWEKNITIDEKQGGEEEEGAGEHNSASRHTCATLNQLSAFTRR